MEQRIRPMQVKVLYTFDDQSKTNCLARCPKPLNVETAYLDQSTQIGIVELSTCVQAITAASPELIARLGQDYTVYAYDYSEYETPLVGQGMLSWVLALSSSTPMAPAMQSKTMVTGRVSKNVLGLFSDGVKETLEVRLRLVPVPTCLQSEYIQSMEQYRDTSNVSAENIDTRAWANFLRENPNFGAHTSPSQQSLPGGEMRGSAIMDGVPLHSDAYPHSEPLGAHEQAAIPTDRQPRVQHDNFVIYAAPETINNARPGTPTQSQRRAPSRPSSRASNRGGNQTRKRRATATSLPEPKGLEMSDAEEGHNRKRAKITRTDWNGPSAFENNEESLRVAASTAASIRGHRPLSALVSADKPFRPPTPRPKSSSSIRRQPTLLRTSTSLSQPAMPQSESTYQSPYPEMDSDAIMTSPEAPSATADSTPQDIPSSPPVPRHASPTPSSPQLPILPNDVDSGFASGPIDECFDDNAAGRFHHSGLRMIPAFQDSGLLTSELPIDHKNAMHTQQPYAKQTQGVFHISGHNDLNAMKQGPVASEDYPRMNPSDYDAQNPRSKIMTEARAEEAGKKGVSTDHGESLRPSSPTLYEGPKPARRGSGAGFYKRQQAIRERLQSSIAAGEIPIHCENCGEIDTAVWRKAFTKTENGPPPDLKPGEEGKVEGDENSSILLCLPVDRDDAGNIASHRIFKKVVPPEEMNLYDEYRLCNPCGIWLFKNKSLRPHDRWTKSADAHGPKKRSRKRPGQPRTPQLQSEAEEATKPLSTIEIGQPIQQWSSGSNAVAETPAAETYEAPQDKSQFIQGLPDCGQGPMDSTAAAQALKYAIQSSPPKFPGSRYSPIHVEDESKKDPTRRLLFPSPRKEGEAKSLQGSPNAGGEARSSQSADDFVKGNKENIVSTSRSSSKTSRHQSEEDKHQVADMTPTRRQTRSSDRTPTSSHRKTLLSNGFLSSAARKWRATYETPSKAAGRDALIPTEMTPFTAQLTQLLSEANTSPSKMGGDFHIPGFGFDDDHDPVNLFAFSDFSTEDLASGDIAMPSSPPQTTVFAVHEDPAEGI